MTDACEHCWHPQNMTHTVMPPPGHVHRDDYCCHCPATRCENVRVEQPEDHGPYYRGVKRIGNDVGALALAPAPIDGQDSATITMPAPTDPAA